MDFDEAKLRLFAGLCGALFGFAGVVALLTAMVILLSTAIGVTAATTIAALLFLSIASGCMYLFLQPTTSTQTEVDQIEDMTAQSLAELPFDAVRSAVEHKPVTTMAIALVTGYALVRNPSGAARTAERLLTQLL